MEYTQNDWVQRDIINKTKIWTKWGKDTVHAVITTKYQKYHSTTILKHANCLAKANKCIAMLDPQTGNVFVLISSVGVQRRDKFIQYQKDPRTSRQTGI